MRWPWSRPAPPVMAACGFCGAPVDKPAPRHRIGDAFKGTSVYDKFCDGSEVEVPR